MSENPLLLSSAKSGVIVKNSSDARGLRVAAAILGVLVIAVGALDVVGKIRAAAGTTHFSQLLSNYDIGMTAFGPAAAINDPSILNRLGSGAPTSTVSSTPTQISIPSIGVAANIEFVGKKSDGSMDTPKDIKNVAWYALGSAPGEKGNAVMAGHVNNALSLPGVFENLSKMKIGDYITLTLKDGNKLVYAVNKINTYPTKDAPLQEIFSTTGPSQVVLITCDGDWIGTEHAFDKRLVVVARLISS